MGRRESARLLSRLGCPLSEEDPFDERRIDLALDEGRCAEDLPVNRDRRLDALDDELAERPPHGRDRLRARRLMDEQLGDQRIVVRRHAVAGAGVRVEPHARAARRLPARDRPGEGRKLLAGSSALMRHSIAEPRCTTVALAERELLAGGDADLLA